MHSAHDDKRSSDASKTTTTDNPADRNKGESETKAWVYPRYVFKRGTGRLMDEKKGLYDAETRLVHDEEEFRRLGDGWLNTPKEAAMGSNVSNANAQILYDEDGNTVEVTPKSTINAPDRSGDFHRRTMIDADELPKPHLENDKK